MSLAAIAPPPGLVPPGMRAEPVGRGGAARLFRAAAPADGAPALLCVPGAYHGAWCYAHWLARFARAGIAAAALEPRGHGTLAAAGLDPATAVADYVDDLRAAVAAGFATPPVLLGHSLGALVVTAAAAGVPVAGLVLVAPSPPGNLPGAAPVAPLLPEGAPLAPPPLEVVVARYLGGARPPGLAAYHAALCPESPRALNDRYALRVAVDPARLAGLPALVLEAGRDDQARHPPGQDRALAAFLGADHVLLPEAPHCLMLAPWEAAAAAPVIAWHCARFRPGR